MAQGDNPNEVQVSRTGENVADGSSITFLQAYSAPFGHPGGPTPGDPVRLMETGHGNWMVLGLLSPITSWGGGGGPAGWVVDDDLPMVWLNTYFPKYGGSNDDTQDCTAAFAALTAEYAPTGARIMAKAGTYLFLGPLVFPHDGLPANDPNINIFYYGRPWSIEGTGTTSYSSGSGAIVFDMRWDGTTGPYLQHEYAWVGGGHVYIADPEVAISWEPRQHLVVPDQQAVINGVLTSLTGDSFYSVAGLPDGDYYLHLDPSGVQVNTANYWEWYTNSGGIPAGSGATFGWHAAGYQVPNPPYEYLNPTAVPLVWFEVINGQIVMDSGLPRLRDLTIYNRLGKTSYYGGGQLQLRNLIFTRLDNPNVDNADFFKVTSATLTQDNVQIVGSRPTFLRGFSVQNGITEGGIGSPYAPDSVPESITAYSPAQSAQGNQLSGLRLSRLRALLNFGTDSHTTVVTGSTFAGDSGSPREGMINSWRGSGNYLTGNTIECSSNPFPVQTMFGDFNTFDNSIWDWVSTQILTSLMTTSTSIKFDTGRFTVTNPLVWRGSYIGISRRFPNHNPWEMLYIAEPNAVGASGAIVATMGTNLGTVTQTATDSPITVPTLLPLSSNYLGSSIVAAGSDGVDVTTFAGAGVLDINNSDSFPSSGAVSLPTSIDTAVINYTGAGLGELTGCTTLSGTGTLSVGEAVNSLPTSIYQYYLIGTNPATQEWVQLSGNTVTHATGPAVGSGGSWSIPVDSSTGFSSAYEKDILDATTGTYLTFGGPGTSDATHIPVTATAQPTITAGDVIVAKPATYVAINGGTAAFIRFAGDINGNQRSDGQTWHTHNGDHLQIGPFTWPLMFKPSNDWAIVGVPLVDPAVSNVAAIHADFNTMGTSNDYRSRFGVDGEGTRTKWVIAEGDGVLRQLADLPNDNTRSESVTSSRDPTWMKQFPGGVQIDKPAPDTTTNPFATANKYWPTVAVGSGGFGPEEAADTSAAAISMITPIYTGPNPPDYEYHAFLRVMATNADNLSKFRRGRKVTLSGNRPPEFNGQFRILDSDATSFLVSAGVGNNFPGWFVQGGKAYVGTGWQTDELNYPGGVLLGENEPFVGGKGKFWSAVRSVDDDGSTGVEKAFLDSTGLLLTQNSVAVDSFSVARGYVDLPAAYVDLAQDLTAYWGMDEGTGSSVGDSSLGSSPNIATAHNCTWVPGVFETGLEFDGATSYVGSSNAIGISGSTVRSINTWAQPVSPLTTQATGPATGSSGSYVIPVVSSTGFTSGDFFAVFDIGGAKRLYEVPSPLPGGYTPGTSSYIPVTSAAKPAVTNLDLIAHDSLQCLGSWGTSSADAAFEFAVDPITGAVEVLIWGAHIAYSTPLDVNSNPMDVYGTPHMFTMTYPAAGTLEDVKFYVDGQPCAQLQGSTNPTHVPSTANTEYSIGYGAPSSGLWFDGWQDEHGVWSRVLSPSDIAILYNDGNGLKVPPFALTMQGGLWIQSPTVGGLQLPALRIDGPSQFSEDQTFNLSHGPVIADTSNGHTYRIISTGGVLSLSEVS